MYECPNCGGNLKFDIPSQQLGCAFCGTQVSPYEIEKETDARESSYFEATVFTCPQCGGEIVSTDNEAAAFCSFCGASTILSSRIRKEKRPKFIIPFQKTKEDCKKAYARKMRRAFFLPKELKDPGFIDSFRGIYMPYWTYQLIQQGEITLKGKTSHREGDYIITEHYRLKGELEAYYLGYAYDASSSFYDNISEALAPYDAKALINFTPSFLSGFYADTADIDNNVYLEDAMELANQSTFQKICREEAFRKYSPDSANKASQMTDALHTTCKSADNTMYPVWFLSYRNGEQVGYATVNGQTGKVVADMPVDPVRYLIGSLLLAVPIFLMLNLAFTIRPTVLLGLSAGLSLFASVIYIWELSGIRRKESLEGDKALALKKQQQKEEKPSPSKKKKKEGKGRGNPVLWVFLLITIGLTVLGISLSLIWSVLVIGAVICAVTGRKKLKAISEEKGASGFYASVAVVAVGALIALFHPVSDLYYYGGAILALLAVMLQFVDIIRKYNRLAMRRLPQFDRQGGDDRA